VRIADFGLARIAADRKLTNSGLIAGTPQYMSPEQANGREIDVRSDLFSLGSVMYAMCAGEDAFRGDSPLATLRQVADQPARSLRDISAQIPEWIVETIEKLMAKSPSDRFQSATELARVLNQHRHDVQTTSDGVGLRMEAQNAEAEVSSSPDQILADMPLSPGSLTKPKPVSTPIEATRFSGPRQFAMTLLGVAMIALISFWTGQTIFRSEPPNTAQSEIQSKKDQRTVTIEVEPAIKAGTGPSESMKLAMVASQENSSNIEKSFAWPEEELWHGQIAAPEMSHANELYRDDFASEKTTWPIVRAGGREYGLEQGMYFISADPGLVGGAMLDEGTYANFACQVVGRVEAESTQWFLNYTSEANDVTVRFHLNGLQGLEVSILNDGPPRVAQTIRHTAINKGDDFNKLLVVAIGNRFEIYANDVAICNPIVLEEIKSPGRFALGAVANENPVRAEFSSFTIWSAERLPSLEVRLAERVLKSQ
jgi:hypothetical protein